jgi:hypothetical protein
VVRAVGGLGGRANGRRGRSEDLIFERAAGERRQKCRRLGRELYVCTRI